MIEELPEIKVFVLLGYGFGADSWRRRFETAQIPGLNEELPYGYHHAAGNGWTVEYSQDRDENGPTRLFRRALGRVFGFDLIHAWRNREQLRSADFVWTHTEREHLAVLLIYRLLRLKNPPKLIAQCVWLFDRWPSFCFVRRWGYRSLLTRADVITTQSPDDLAVAKQLFPDVRSELVLSGAATMELATPARRHVSQPIRLAALGNDMHRDWKTLIDAFGETDLACQVIIVSSKFNAKLVRHLPNFSILRASTAQEIKDIYKWADIVVVPLKFNLHVSGITVVFEALVSGVAVVCTEVGGMRAYFSDSEIHYVPLGSATSLREAVRLLAADEDLRFRLVANGQRKLLADKLTKQGYAQRHKELSELLLAGDTFRKIPRVRASHDEEKLQPEREVEVFVHLGHGFGAKSWQRRFSAGLIPGLNEPQPYGYHRAASKQWRIEYSEDGEEGSLLAGC